VTSPDLHRAVGEIEGGCDATVLCNQKGLAQPSAPSSARKRRGCADQVRARRLGFIAFSPAGYIAGKISPDRPCAPRERQPARRPRATPDLL